MSGGGRAARCYFSARLKYNLTDGASLSYIGSAAFLPCYHPCTRDADDDSIVAPSGLTPCKCRRARNISLRNEGIHARFQGYDKRRRNVVVLGNRIRAHFGANSGDLGRRRITVPIVIGGIFDCAPAVAIWIYGVAEKCQAVELGVRSNVRSSGCNYRDQCAPTRWRMTTWLCVAWPRLECQQRSAEPVLDNQICRQKRLSSSAQIESMARMRSRVCSASSTS